MGDALEQLTRSGVAVWLDDLGRQRLTGGGLADLARHRHVTGVTSNPTTFTNAVANTDAYAGQLTDLALRRVGVESAQRELNCFDVRWACDVLRPAYEDSDGVDGRVSIEVAPGLAYDSERTVAEARALWWLVDRPNLFVKIPATRQGLPAISTCLAEGISINVTLMFSLERYRQVQDAFLTGMAGARDAGHDLSRIGSVASIFVSRIDTEVDQRLDKIADEAARRLRGSAAVANARSAHRLYEQMVGEERWTSLADAGARPQRLLWASTGVKDPSYDDTRYVVDLVTDGVVCTMPETTLHAVADHGRIRGDTVREHYDEAQRVLDSLREVGVDYDDVMAVLEKEGVEKFSASWEHLGEILADQLKTGGASSGRA
ncbi:transaldolase [Streptomyces montanus]|uniref:Transaldolase n=1 Tax=Streptomyces montanus TaxID=2580423 RepID=A0A5R9FT02_9ACTN|nr:transaldolase [Streptomyces montanus]TLS47147.1 transaldolase [Streptomyces montanus]